MSIKLVQKAFLNGTREFEITDDVVNVRIKKLLGEEKLTVGLSTLNPEPVVNGSELEFYGRSGQGPLLSLLLNKPDAEKFNAFVDALKQRALGEDNTIAGVEAVSSETRTEALARNVYEEPPEFEDSNETGKGTGFQPVNAERVDDDITMLRTYLDEADIKPFLDALETLKADPQNEAAFQKVVDAYNGPGINQGAVLTYAPYISTLLSKSIWSSM
jgi:hypothetical protein